MSGIGARGPGRSAAGEHSRVDAQPASARSTSLSPAIGYTLSLWTALTRYRDDGRIEIDNNALSARFAPSPWKKELSVRWLRRRR